MASIMFRTCAVMCAPLILAACTAVPLTSLPKLMSLDPTTLDYGGVEAAFRVQEGFDISPGEAVLTVTISAEGLDEDRVEKVPLEETPVTASPFLSKQRKKGYHIRRFSAAGADHARIADIRAAIDQFFQGEFGKGEFSISPSAIPCVLDAKTLETQRPRLTIYMKTADNDDFFTLLKERKYEIPVEDGKTALDLIPLCEAALETAPLKKTDVSASTDQF